MKHFTLIILLAFLANSLQGQDVRAKHPVITYGSDVTTPHLGGFYSKIPLDQLSNYKFGLSLINIDTEEDATSSYVFTATVEQGGTKVYQVSASPVTSISAGDTVELELDSLYTPDDSYLGWYKINFDVSEDGESIYSKDWYFETTKDVYAHDSNNVTSLNLSPLSFINGGDENGDRFNVMYDLYDTAEVAGMWVHIHDFTDPGVSLVGHIMRYVGGTQFFDDGSISTAWNLNTARYGDNISTESFEVKEEDVGNWVYLPFKVVNGEVYPKLVPEQYCVSLEILYKGLNFSITRSTVNLDVQADYVAYMLIKASTGYAILDDMTYPLREPNLPMARMQLMREECKGFSDVLIDETNSSFDEINLIYGTRATGWATVDIESPNGGLTCTWTKRGDKDFSYTGDTLVATEVGAYSVIMTDSEGCINGTNFYIDNNLAAADYLAEKASLSQNAPNPFGQQTRISYEILQESNIQFIFTNALGSVVKTIDKGQVGPGQYVLELDASEFSNGVYYYSMIVDGQKITRKMIVTK